MPLGLEATVSLREITQETVNFILNLRVAKEQEQFVASNAVSIAEASLLGGGMVSRNLC